MPEEPEIKGTAHVVEKGKGSGLSPQKYEELRVCSNLSLTRSSLPFSFCFPQFFVQFVPLCLSLGTDKHHYESVTANRDDYSLDSESPSAPTLISVPVPISTPELAFTSAPSAPLTPGSTLGSTLGVGPIVSTPDLRWLDMQWPPTAWRERAAVMNKSWSYLLDPPKLLGPLICVTRGKLLLMAAGNVSYHHD